MIDKTGSIHAQLVMDQIKAYQTRVNQTRESEAAITPTEVQKPSFGQTVSQMVSDVNSAQMQAAELRTAYERGENIPLTDVVIGMQKSSLAFEATLQIRNKVLKAYEEIMNMPVLGLGDHNGNYNSRYASSTGG